MRGNLLVIVALSSLPASALCQVLRVDAAASGGFTGFKVAEAISTPAFDCIDGQACTPVADSVDLMRNTFYRWTPALSSGIVVTVGGETDSSFGAGLGAHIVFASDGDGTRPLPAVTFHLGNQKFQAFFGLIFAASDEVEFPNRRESIRVGADNVPNFVKPRAGSGPNLFFGIVLGGTSVLKAGGSEE